MFRFHLNRSAIAASITGILLAIPFRAVADDSSFDLNRAKDSFTAHRWQEAEATLFQIWNEIPVSESAEEAGVLLADVYLQEEKLPEAEGVIHRFKREFPTSSQLPRMEYDQGVVDLKKGLNSEAATLLEDVLSKTITQGVHDAAAKALNHLIENQQLSPTELDAARSSLQGSTLSSGGDRKTDRNVLMIAPYTGDFAEVGKAMREGVSLAFEEAKAQGLNPPNLKTLDDQGNLVQAVHQLRKMLNEDHIDAVLGPAMSDVAAGVAIDLSARKSSIPVITPTATTYGIASLGEGVFQLNVTTHVLGQRIAEYAVDCLGLREFVVASPHSEYGFQLTEAFTETVRQKGGTVIAAAYFDPDAADLTEPLQGLREKTARYFFEKMKSSDPHSPEKRLTHAYLTDSTLHVDGIFIPGASGEEVDKIASQLVFNKIRGQMLGSSGWYDKELILKNSSATQGAYFSVDFQDQPKTAIYRTFSAAYKNRWKHAPDRVAALSYDAARFLLQGMQKSSQPATLIPTLHSIQTFPGVLGDIAFGKEGVNQNVSLFHLERRSFEEVSNCAVDTSR